MQTKPLFILCLFMTCLVMCSHSSKLEKKSPLTTVDAGNIAEGKSASQSSVEYGGEASRAVDGNTDGDWQNESVTHTQRTSNPWWQVDLGEVKTIGEVRIYNRTDCCENRLQNIFIALSESNDPANAFGGASSVEEAEENGYSVFRVLIHADMQQSTLHVPAGNQAQIVRVWMDGTNGLSLAEVEIFETITPGPEVEVFQPNNLALGMSASQISTDHGGVASRAVDGVTNGEWGSGSVTHTTSIENPWWQVDLGSTREISEVKLYNRSDACCSHRLRNVYLVLSNSANASRPFGSASSPHEAEEQGFEIFRIPVHPDASMLSVLQLPAVERARYARIWMDGSGILSLAEVEILEHIDETIDVDLPENLALHKSSRQSTTFAGGTADRANDGDRNGEYHDGSVSHTAQSDNPWWEVDLGSSSQIGEVSIYNRTDCCPTRLSDVYVALSNGGNPDQPFQGAGTPTQALAQGYPVIRIDVNPNASGVSIARFLDLPRARFVRIWKEGNGILSLAEVEISQVNSATPLPSGLPPLLNPPAGVTMSTISVVVVYNNFVQDFLDRDPGVTAEGKVAQAFQDANDIYRRSGVWQRLELANLHYEEMTEDENGGLYFGMLNSRDFGMESNVLTNQRREHNADMVIFWSKPGSGYPVARSLSAHAQDAFINIPGISMYGSILVHEIGHLQGATHEEGRVFPIEPDQSGYATVMMNYGDCLRTGVENGVRKVSIPILSNPEVQYQGVPTGEIGVWNTARILNENREIMAGFGEELDGFRTIHYGSIRQLQRIQSISLGPDGSRYATDENDQLWKWEISDWVRIHTLVGARKVSVGDEEKVWFVGGDGDLYEKNGPNWTRRGIPVPAAEVAAGPDGTVFVVDENHDVWKWNGSAFVQTSHNSPSNGGMMEGTNIASSGVGHTWAVGPNHDLWKWIPSRNQWEIRSSSIRFEKVSTQSNGHIWVIDSNSRLYCTVDQGSNFISFANGEEIKLVACAGDNIVWKVDQSNDVEKLVDVPVTAAHADVECYWKLIRWLRRAGRF